MKTAFKKMRGRLSQTQQALPPGPMKPSRDEVPDPLYSLKDTMERSSTIYSMRASMDSRKRSGSFGSRMLRRAKSAVGRQNKKTNDDENSNAISSLGCKDSPRARRAIFQKQMSLNENLMNQYSRRTVSPPNEYSTMRSNAFDGTFYEDDSVSFRESDKFKESSVSSDFPTILMQGDLSRRRRLAWSKMWAVLTSDRVLTMYKTKEDFEISRKEWSTMQNGSTGASLTLEKTTITPSGNATSTAFLPRTILSIINLNRGCEIENVVQGKKSTTFQLIPHTYQTMSQGTALTLPLEAGCPTPIKPVHLMCKNNDEFLYWVKAFVQLNTNDSPSRNVGLKPLRICPDLPANSQDQTERLPSQKDPHLSMDIKTAQRVSVSCSATNATSSMNGSTRQVRENEESISDAKAETAHCLGQATDSRDTKVNQVTDFSPKAQNLVPALEQIRFIDEEDDYAMSGVRLVSDFNDNISGGKPALTPRSIFRLTNQGKQRVQTDEPVATKAEEKVAFSKSRTTQNSFDEKRKTIDSLRKRIKKEEATNGTEFKKCSTTEKLHMRTAQIVAGVSGKGTPVKLTPAKDTHHSESSGKNVIEVENQHKTCESFISRGDSNEDDREHYITEYLRSKRRVRNDPSPIGTKTNKARREKSSGEKRSTEKKSVIGEASSRDRQTKQSIQHDKSSGISSLGAPVYSDRKVANENISSGEGSVKDKHSELSNTDNSSECDSQALPENRKDLHSYGNRERDLKDAKDKYTDRGNPCAVSIVVEEPSASQTEKTNPISVNLAAIKNERNSIRHLKARSKAIANIRKQKSLRQTVLRKLGSKVSLSNSTPDLNSAEDSEDVENTLGIPLSEYSSVSSPVSPVNLKRHTAFRDKPRAPLPAVVTRSLSEGDLLEAIEEVDGRNMRTFKNVRKLTQENFIETYGVIPRKKNGKHLRNQKRHTTYDESKQDDLPGLALYADDDIQNEYLNNGGCHRRVSTSDSNSSESSYQASLTNSDPQTREVLESTRKASLTKTASHDDIHNIVVATRPKSIGSDDSGSRHSSSKDESRNSWLSSLTPHFVRKANKSSNSTSAPKNSSQASRRAVFQIPATQLTSAAHRGYLDRRNKKKQWERFWCVLQDSCLYCYNSPQSEYTQDAVVLRGYDVIADVTNLNRSRFSFRLERNGSPTFHFSSENHQQFLLWVGTLERETSVVLPATSDNEVLVNSVKTTANIFRHDNVISHDAEGKNETADRMPDHETYELQKENLLREVLAQQHKLIEEQKLLHEKNANVSLSTLPSYGTKRISKDQVNEKYSRAKDDEEMKIMKSLTHLNRRRNSAQLKVDQITKQLAPKSGRKRRENPQQFAEMEASLRQLQERLAAVDKEIQDKHALRQDVIEKIHQRRDLELLVLEQQESIAIIRRHQAQQKRQAFAEQTQPQQTNERLASIDEMSSISDCSSTSSNSLPDPLTLGLDTRLQAMSTPRQSRANGTIPDPDCFHRSDIDDVMSQGNSSVEGGLVEDFRSMSTSSEETEKMITRRTISSASATSLTSMSSFEDAPRKSNEVHPSILAEIEDFQRFSKQKLAKLGSNN